jgi:GT2 family glycosyltransferase
MKFSISILTYTALPMARKCIESVLKHSSDFELILTDNGGPPEVGKYFDELAAKDPRIVVIHNAKNLGFIEPNRVAFRRATGKYFILLNDDTVVSANWLDLLAAPFTTDRNCAMTGPAGGCCQLRSDFHGESGPRFEYLEGAMLCMDRELVASVEPNLFPAELEGAYCEDSYLSLRLREAGYSLHRVAVAFVHHRCSTSQLVPQCRDWQAANQKFLQQRFRRYIVNHRFDYPTIVKRNAAWGDVLLTTPIIKALRKLRPLSPIWVETQLPEVFNGNPDVALVARNIVQPEPHVMINLNGISEMNPAKPIIEAYAECADVVLAGETTALFPNGGDVEWAQRQIPGGGWVAIGIGPTSWKCKNWPFDRWATVIKALRADGWKVVLVGADRAPMMESDLDLRGKTNVAQLAALLGVAALFIGLDSFPIHAAQAMGTPVIGLFGITTARNILTSGSHWVACQSAADHPGTGLRHKKVGVTFVDCPENPMETITTDEVLKAAACFHPGVTK